MHRALLLAAAVLIGCTPVSFDARPPDAAFLSAAVAHLDSMQPRSIATDREWCGFMGYSADGEVIVTEPVPGAAESCDLGGVPTDFEVIAMVHTHGAYSRDYWSELPSIDDVRAALDVGLFSLIATPGGRVWMVDWRDGVSRQICGRGCVRADPGFRPEERIASRYGFNDLIGLQR